MPGSTIESLGLNCFQGEHAYGPLHPLVFMNFASLFLFFELEPWLWNMQF